MRVAWRGPLLCGSAHAAGAREALRGLVAAGAEVRVEQTPWARPAALGAEERAWLAARQAGSGRVDAHVQRTLARLVDPLADADLVAGWFALPAADADAETLLRARACDLVWVADDAQRTALVEAGAAEARVRVLPEPAAPPPAGAPRPAALPARGTVVVALAPPGRAGGADLLVGAWARAFAPGDDVALVWLLDAEDPHADAARAGEEAVAALLERGLDPERLADLVIVPDPLDAAAVGAVLAAAHAVVLPARAPDLGRAAALARAAGLPPVGTASAGVDEAHGYVVPAVVEPADAAAVPGEAARWRGPHEEALADALRRLHRDPAGRARRGRASAARGADHAPAAVGRRMLADLAGLHRRPRRPSPRTPLLVVEGDLLGATSLAGVNRALLGALAGVPDLRVAALERDARRVEPLDPHGPVAAAMGVRGTPDVVVRHTHPPAFAPAARGRLVQWAHWEFGAPPREWREGLSRCDEVWVASDGVGEALRQAGLSHVHVVPLGVDAARFAGAPPADLGGDAPGFRFLFVGGLVWRKGADLLLEAYARAFTRDDDVTLVLKDFGHGGPYPAGDDDARAARMAADDRGPRVHRVSGALPHDALPGLYAACDCLVHPYRAEAFGLTMLEAAAAGLPVIASGHGPVRGFLGPDAADLLDTRPVTLRLQRIGPWTLDGPVTAREPSVEELAAAMRRRYERRDEGRALGARAARVAATRTWERSASVIRERVALLAGAGLRAA